MSDVARYYIGVFGGEAQARVCLAGLRGMIRDSEGKHFTLADDFDRVTGERDAALAELALANEKIDKAWNRTAAIDHKGFIPGAMDAWKRPVPQHLPYDFSGSTSASTIQYCNGWNDSGGYWSSHAANLIKKVDALQQRLTAADERSDALEADKKRLDLWQNNPGYFGGFAPSGDWSFFNPVGKTCYGKTLRDALDQLAVMDADLKSKV